MDEALLASCLGLAAQAADIDVERVRPDAEVEAPHLGEDESPGQDAARVAQQDLEQVELDRGEIDRPPAAAHDARPRIEPQVVEAKDVFTVEIVSTQADAETLDEGRGLTEFATYVAGRVV